jgi:hypothetical protein
MVQGRGWGKGAWLIGFLVLFWTLFTCESRAQQTAPLSTSDGHSDSPISDGHTVLYIGDSQAGGAFGAAFDSLLRSWHLATAVHTYAAGGTRIRQWLRGGRIRHSLRIGLPGTAFRYTGQYRLPSIESLLTSLNPNLLIIQLGGNHRGQSRIDFQSELQQLLDSIPPQTACIWITPPVGRTRAPQSGLSREDIVQEIVYNAAHKCLVLDSRLIAPPYPAHGGDGVHYAGPRGRALARTWAQRAFEVLLTSGL